MVLDYGVLDSDGKLVTAGLSAFKCFGWGECCDGVRVVEFTKDPEPASSFFPAKGYWTFGDADARIGRLAQFMFQNFPAYTGRAALGNYYGVNIKRSLAECQRRTGLGADGNVGPITLAKLKQYGFGG